MKASSTSGLPEASSMSSRVLPSSLGPNMRPWHTRNRENLVSAAGGAAPQPVETPEERRHSIQSETERMRQELEDIRMDGYRSGLADGRIAAENELRGETDAASERLAQSIASLADVKPRLRREAEKELLELCFAVARRIVRRELTLDPECIMGLLQAGLAKISRNDLNSVRIHPQFATRVSAELESMGISNVEVIPDPSLVIGDILFQTSRGTLDAQLETHFSEIVNGLADHI